MRRAAAFAVGLALAATAACGAGSWARSSAGSSSSPQDTGGRDELVVFSASSLSGVVAELGRRFEAEHPGTRVVVSAAGSSTLAQQVVAGAPADLFAAASPATMGVVVRGGQADGAPVVIARNVLQIAVPPGNPGDVRGLADLGRPELDVALCAVHVPCGAAAARAFEAAGLTASPDTLEQDVRAVLTKVRLGEVDAGLVYATDVRSAPGDVEGIAFPEAATAVSDYPAVVLRSARDPALARQLLQLLRSADGREVLTAAGFALPR